MSKRTRHYVNLFVAVVVGAVYARGAGHWSDLAFYGIGAVVLAVFVLAALFWLELAPDGAFRDAPRGG